MKRWERAAAAALVLAVLFSFSGFTGACEGIPDRVVRLHVLANSDSEEDQALKLAVRDAVLQAGSGLLDGAADRAGAEARLQESLPVLEQAAHETLAAQGCGDPVRVELTTCYFPTRTYGEWTLPAGNYRAVRVVIGEGQGHNWWCVLFPPLCLPAAQGSPGLEDVLTAPQMDLVSGGYEVRFKLVEYYEQLRAWLSGNA